MKICWRLQLGLLLHRAGDAGFSHTGAPGVFVVLAALVQRLDDGNKKFFILRVLAVEHELLVAHPFLVPSGAPPAGARQKMADG